MHGERLRPKRSVTEYLKLLGIQSLDPKRYAVVELDKIDV